MKRISLFILIMFIGIGLVNALEKAPELEIISNNDDSVVLRVNIRDIDKNEVCYIHRSLDNTFFNDKIIVDCNKMYTDNNIDKDMIYYYKASVGKSEVFSEVIMIDTYTEDLEEDVYENVEKTPRDPFVGIVVFIVTAVIFLILVMILIIVSRKYVDTDKNKKNKKSSVKK